MPGAKACAFAAFVEAELSRGAIQNGQARADRSLGLGRPRRQALSLGGLLGAGARTTDQRSQFFLADRFLIQKQPGRPFQYVPPRLEKRDRALEGLIDDAAHLLIDRRGGLVGISALLRAVVGLVGGILATGDERRYVGQGSPTGTRRATRGRVIERTRSSNHAASHRSCRPALLCRSASMGRSSSRRIRYCRPRSLLIGPACALRAVTSTRRH